MTLQENKWKNNFSPEFISINLKSWESEEWKKVNIESKFSVKKQKVILQPSMFCTPMDLLKCSGYPSTFLLKIFFQKSHWNLIQSSIVGNSIHLLPGHKTLRVGRLRSQWSISNQITGNEGGFRDVLFHPLSHRDRDNHSTHRWPSGLIGWPGDFDTYLFSLNGKCLHTYL